MEENLEPLMVPLVYGVTILFFMATLLFMASVGFIINILIESIDIFLATLAWLVCWVFTTKIYLSHISQTKIVLLIASQLLFFTLAFYLCGRVYDLSFDGQWYHQEGIYRLFLKYKSYPLRDFDIVGIIYVTARIGNERDGKNYPKQNLCYGLYLSKGGHHVHSSS
jgi:hypothetical protein